MNLLMRVDILNQTKIQQNCSYINAANDADNEDDNEDDTDADDNKDVGYNAFTSMLMTLCSRLSIPLLSVRSSALFIMTHLFVLKNTASSLHCKCLSDE